jgi:hypothetical protein
MATLKQILANRRNAQKSCGPKSDEGKAIVSKNRLMHGLCGDFYVLDFEDQARFEELLAQFVRDEKPVGSVEHELVVKMARHTWMSHRAIRMQDACLLPQPQTSEQKARGDNALEVRKRPAPLCPLPGSERSRLSACFPGAHAAKKRKAQSRNWL